jgi:hypothetical protein
MLFKVGDWIVSKEEVLEKLVNLDIKTKEELKRPMRISSLKINSQYNFASGKGWIEVSFSGGTKQVYAENYRLATEREIKYEKIKYLFLNPIS